CGTPSHTSFIAQQNEALCALTSKPHAVRKLMLEFDETQQMMRVRSALLGRDVQGCYPVMIQRWTVICAQQLGMSPKICPVIVPPCVLQRTDAPTLWAAVNNMGARRLWDMFDGASFGILSIVSDRCATNESVIAHAIRTKPDHVAVNSHGCNAHE
ncbi:unnamed protein product, partial [Polarella glacialis]